MAQKLRDLWRLRNRIAHYEPMLAQPIAQLHADVLALTSCMSVDAAAWITTHSDISGHPDHCCGPSYWRKDLRQDLPRASSGLIELGAVPIGPIYVAGIASQSIPTMRITSS